MQGEKLEWYHFKMFYGKALDYPTYDKKLYPFVWDA